MGNNYVAGGFTEFFGEDGDYRFGKGQFYSGEICRMMKQYGIDPKLVIWIQRNTGRDLQTFSDLAKIKSLDSRRRNYSAVKKVDDVATEDYSFLTGCRNLNTLDLQDTAVNSLKGAIVWKNVSG